MKWEFICVFVLNLISLSIGLEPTDDPYKILGVKKSATVQELRKAYKKLAKEWHPDKNDDPRAAGKFVEITQAYELLTDPDRRKQYDYHGIINPDSNRRPDFHTDEFDPFDDIFNFPNGFRFTSQTTDFSLYHRLSITTRKFENTLLPRSHTVPYLVLFYSDLCFYCIKLEPIWRKIVEDFEPIGIKIATVHSSQEPSLVRRCGITTVPTLVMLIEGRINYFKDTMFSVQKMAEFVRSNLPHRLFVHVKNENLNGFLEGWHDNRVRALVFQKSDTIRLRYLLMAFYYSERVYFGFVRLNSPDTSEIQKKYKVPPDSDTLLLFNENTNRPIVSLSMPVIPVQTMKDVITENNYLILPRLSSQKVMDSICPVEWASRRKRLCVVLISENTREHDEPRQAMRQFAQETTYKSERVRFSYIYQEKQPEFVRSLRAGSPGDTVLNVVILWRRDVNHIKYEWMQGSWSFDKESPELNKTKEKLESIISKLLKTDETLSYEAVVKELIDEHAQTVAAKVINRFFSALNSIQRHFGRDEIFTIGSVVGTVMFFFAAMYFMIGLVRQEEEKIRNSQTQNGYQKMNNGGMSYTPQLRLYELRAEKYNGMVRMLKPGCRTIVLLLDQQSRDTLLPEFHSIVWPYRKNKTLMFGFMFIEKGLEWYKRLLTLSLSEPRELFINPRNCIGTVLSLNGYRKYFCMYHAKLSESFKRRRTKKLSKYQINNSAGPVKVGTFMGFEESSDSESDENFDVELGTKSIADEDLPESDHVLLQSNLLKELPNWLDRLFEGTTHRFSINYWPDFPNNAESTCNLDVVGSTTGATGNGDDLVSRQGLKISPSELKHKLMMRMFMQYVLAIGYLCKLY